MKAAVFFDRDGVLNQPIPGDGRVYAPLTVEDFSIYPEAPQAVAQVRDAGFLAIVVTNQPEITKGNLPQAVLDEMHRILKENIELDAVYVCPHVDDQQCGCRKPAPGMLEQAAYDLDVDLSRSFMVGDTWRDIDAGRAAGCRTVLVEDPANRQKGSEAIRADYRASDVSSAVVQIISLRAGATPGV